MEAENKKERYGLLFPEHVTDISIELWCYRNNHPKEKGGLGAAGHLKRAIQILFPEETRHGSPLYVWHPWIDDRVEAWCRCNGTILTGWGPAASAKSTDFGMIALVDWYAAPAETTTIICSTTLTMLHRRIWGEVVRFHQLYKNDGIGQYIKSKTCIVLNPDQFEQEIEKAGIFGFAVQQGSVKEARDNIIGQHNRRIRLLVDEAQHPALEVAFEARANLKKGCQDFKLVAFGNPDSRLDPLGRYSEPAAGWDSVNPDMDGWNTKYGECRFYDGLKSPGMTNPAKYHFLIGKQDFEDTADDQGYDSPDYWQFCRGYVRPEGSSLQIISESFAIKHKMLSQPEWVRDYIMGAGFDPSYSSGGDHRVIIPFQAGMSTWGLKIIAFLEPVQINIEVSKLEEKTFARQLAEKAIEVCTQYGVSKQYFGMDTTGAQTILADFIDEIWTEPGRIHRCEFGGSASELPASERNKDPAKDVYANRVTELWFNMVSFGRSNQIRNLPLVALKQFTMRNLVSNVDRLVRTTKRQIEPKKIMKNRTGGRSPDEADASCVCLDTARVRMNIHPGSTNYEDTPYSLEDHAVTREYQEIDVDGHSDLYLTTDV